MHRYPIGNRVHCQLTTATTWLKTGTEELTAERPEALGGKSMKAVEGNGKWRRLVSRILLLAISVQVLVGAQRAESAAVKVDYSKSEVPLYEQITAQIRAKVAERLHQQPSQTDRFFIIPFAYQNAGNDPEFSHSFITVIRVFGTRNKTRLVKEARGGRYKQWDFEAFTISWIPYDFAENPNLCVFNGFGSRLIPSWNQCPVSVGRNFTLAETIQLAVRAKVAVGMWGPYEISEDAFERAVKRMRLLNTGIMKYRADDRGYRKDRVAINCFHAMAGLDELYPNGGIFGTGFKMWGVGWRGLTGLNNSLA
ncbi:MAG: hypothetical protein EOP84_36045 [Verrucomicrobiaceae bacterium]|nr:MAG: hypothetical protein EOP84_36045 [Verrucomicrobiaceae bacterium]